MRKIRGEMIVVPAKKRSYESDWPSTTVDLVYVAFPVLTLYVPVTLSWFWSALLLKILNASKNAAT